MRTIETIDEQPPDRILQELAEVRAWELGGLHADIYSPETVERMRRLQEATAHLRSLATSNAVTVRGQVV